MPEYRLIQGMPKIYCLPIYSKIKNIFCLDMKINFVFLMLASNKLISCSQAENVLILFP